MNDWFHVLQQKPKQTSGCSGYLPIPVNNMKMWHRLCLLLSTVLIQWEISLGFVMPDRSSGWQMGRRRPTELQTATADLGSTTLQTEKYDIVKVDLDDGRDYPIYIGSGYSDEEGMYLCV